MPQVNLTTEELTIIHAALEAAQASAARAQKTGKSPQIIEVYKLHEASIKELDSKITKSLFSKQ